MKSTTIKAIKFLFMTLTAAGLTALIFFIIRLALQEHASSIFSSILMLIPMGIIPIAMFAYAKSIPTAHDLPPHEIFALLIIASSISLLCFIIAYILAYVELFVEVNNTLGPVIMLGGSGSMFAIISTLLRPTPTQEPKGDDSVAKKSTHSP